MSKTTLVSFRGRLFGASDVIASIFLKHLIEASQQLAVVQLPWVAKIVDSWKVEIGMLGDTGIELDDKWSDAQVEIVVRLIEAACEALAERQVIPRDEIESWKFLDGERFYTRGLREVATDPIIQLGQGMISLLRGTLPETPDRTDHWYYTSQGRWTFAEANANAQEATLKRQSETMN